MGTQERLWEPDPKDLAIIGRILDYTLDPSDENLAHEVGFARLKLQTSELSSPYFRRSQALLDVIKASRTNSLDAVEPNDDIFTDGTQDYFARPQDKTPDVLLTIAKSLLKVNNSSTIDGLKNSSRTGELDVRETKDHDNALKMLFDYVIRPQLNPEIEGDHSTTLSYFNTKLIGRMKDAEMLSELCFPNPGSEEVKALAALTNGNPEIILGQIFAFDQTLLEMRAETETEMQAIDAEAKLVIEQYNATKWGIVSEELGNKASTLIMRMVDCRNNLAQKRLQFVLDSIKEFEKSHS